MFLTDINWLAIFKIIGIDIMLGVDNAIVIALACAALPATLRLRATLWGTAGAVGLRALLLVFASYLMGLPYVKLVAGVYLLYIGYHLLVSNTEGEEPSVTPAEKVLGAIRTIIVADFMMSLDNVLAVAGAASGAGTHSTVYAIVGICFSIPIIVFGATLLTRVMARFPIVVWIGGGLLGWVGAELIFSDPASQLVFAPLQAELGTHTAPVVATIGFVAVIFAANVHDMLKKIAKQSTKTV